MIGVYFNSFTGQNAPWICRYLKNQIWQFLISLLTDSNCLIIKSKLPIREYSKTFLAFHFPIYWMINLFLTRYQIQTNKTFLHWISYRCIKVIKLPTRYNAIILYKTIIDMKIRTIHNIISFTSSERIVIFARWNKSFMLCSKR